MPHERQFVDGVKPSAPPPRKSSPREIIIASVVIAALAVLFIFSQLGAGSDSDDVVEADEFQVSTAPIPIASDPVSTTVFVMPEPYGSLGMGVSDCLGQPCSNSVRLDVVADPPGGSTTSPGDVVTFSIQVVNLSSSADVRASRLLPSTFGWSLESDSCVDGVVALRGQTGTCEIRLIDASASTGNAASFSADIEYVVSVGGELEKRNETVQPTALTYFAFSTT